MSLENPNQKTLFELLRSCKMGEAGAIVGGHIDRNQLRQQLYVPTEQDEIVSSFFVDDYMDDGQMLIITGSAGDGKSALLSRAFKEARENGIDSLTENQIHMDATASTRKTETYDKTLARFLDDAVEGLRSGRGPRTGLAINLGLAIDFFERRGYRDQYPLVWDAIEAAKGEETHDTDRIQVLNLSHRQLYDTHPDRLGQGLLRKIVDKFDVSDPDSPFHAAYKREQEECPAGEACPLHYNVTQFTDEGLREQVTQLLAAKSIVENSYLNPRRMLDHLASILLPAELEQTAASDAVCPVGKSVQYHKRISPDSLVWNTVFREVDDQNDPTGLLDPAAQATETIDLEILQWGANPSKLETDLGDVPHIDSAPIEDKIRTTIHKQYLEEEGEGEGVQTALDWSWFTEFLGTYTYMSTSEDGLDSEEHELEQSARTLNKTLTQALKGWSGDVIDGDYIEFVDGIKTPEYRFLAKWANPRVNLEVSRERTRREPTPGQLWFVLEPEGATVDIPVPINFELYILMNRIRKGYTPNARDLERSEGIRLIHSRLSEFTNKKETVRILDKVGSELLRLEEDAFGGVIVGSGGNR